jgi:hypothetical protein
MSDAPAGSYTITLHINSGSLSYVQPGQSYLKAETGDLSDKHAYAGTLITEKTQTSVTLASALTKMLPAGSPVVINLQMYSPVLLSPGTTFRKQPSIQAFGRYVHFLETQVAASGIQGRVSIWNEPPWAGDPWDAAANLYDTPPAEQRIKQDFGVELAYYAATLPPVNGVMLDNGYTNKTGNGSLFVPERRNLLPSLDALHKIFASESFHPYGNNPEDSAWLPGCIKTHTTPALYGHVFHDCTPVGMVTGSNIKWEAAINESSGSLTGLDLGITETGLARGGTSAATEEQITRFDLRQFLVFAGSNVHPILFYRLAGDPPYEWLHEDHSPYPVYMAFQNLMQTIGYIAHTPMSPFPQCALPTVHDYAGAYPLALTIFTGASDEGGKRSSLLLYTWQRTYSSGRWTALPSPSLTNLSLNIPPGLTVRTVRDTVGNTPVLYSLRGNTLTYPVADNPVEVLLTPANNVRTPPVLCGS